MTKKAQGTAEFLIILAVIIIIILLVIGILGGFPALMKK